MNTAARTVLTLSLVVIVSVAGCVSTPAEKTANETTPGSASTSSITAEHSTLDKTDEPPTVDRLVSEHTAALNEAGSFTLSRSGIVHLGTADKSKKWNSTGHVDTESGAILSFLNISGYTYTTYVSPSKKPYQKVSFPESDSHAYQNPHSSTPTIDRFRRAPLADLLASFEFHRNGSTTLDGKRVAVYTVSSVVRSPNRNLSALRFDPANVTRTKARLYVTESGLVKKLTYNVTTSSGGTTRTYRSQFFYGNLGTTEVDEPNWIDEAAVEIYPHTGSIRNESLGVSVTVSDVGQADEALTVKRRTRGVFSHGDGAFREAQVSPLVAVRLEYGSTVNLTAIRFSYDESAIPDGDEQELSVYRWNWTSQTFDSLETTIDDETNVVQAEIDREGVYLVMHTETWRELFE